MDTQDMSPLPPSHDHTSRPSLGFPLGAALLLVVILALSAVFSCCYHWDKFRSFRRNLAAASPDLQDQDSPPKATTTSTSSTRDQGESLPVVMPGDNVPKYIALSCPCEPHRLERVVLVEAQRKPPKLPRFPVRVP